MLDWQKELNDNGFVIGKMDGNVLVTEEKLEECFFSAGCLESCDLYDDEDYTSDVLFDCAMVNGFDCLDDFGDGALFILREEHKWMCANEALAYFGLSK